MTIIRPKTLPEREKRLDWLTMVGAADERDGRALDSLARALRLIAQSWVMVMAARMAMMTIFVGFGRVHELGSNAIFLFFLGVAVLSDSLIALSPFIRPLAKIPPNSRLAMAAPMIFGSSAVYELCGTSTLVHQPAALLAATLGPAMLAVVIFGRLRLLSLSYAAGALMAQLVSLPDLHLAAPFLVFIASLGLVLWAKLRIGRRAATFTFARESVLTGEQAKALLVDFEKAGRGWFWETDRAGNISYISDTLAAQIGQTSLDLIGTPFTALFAAPDANSQLEGQRTVNFQISARTAFSDIAVLAANSTEERWWSVSGQPVVTPFGQFLGFRGSGSDLTEMRRSQAEVARLASVDPLTGLANRTQMQQALEQAINGQRGMIGHCAMFLLDLDRFKEVNDTMGHPAGDALLRQVAQRLTRIVGTQGKVGRLGGDEFQIVLPGMVDVVPLTKLAEAIIHSLSQPYSIEGSQVVIGASIGIALAPEDGNSADTLIRNADLALYAAKADGRGLFRYFVPAMHADAEDRRQLEADLRHAIVSGSLHLEYQPVVCASSEKITGFEALIRWNHMTRGEISPTVFIPIAEDAGLIDAIGEWVLRSACRDAAQLPEGTRIAVNVSPCQFANAALPSVVMSALAAAGLCAERLELEITESVFLADRANTDGMFSQLKKIGVRLALDDFGTGYSALGYLKTAPFDKIKIDQSFVRGAAIEGSRNAAIVQSIVNLAEALGMETTAEGAETLDELELIRSLGCSHVQGFVYGRPMSMADALALLDKHDGHAEPKGHKSSRKPRMTMLRSITLIHDGNRYPARIRNISASGAMIEGLLEVPNGTEFTIEFGANHTVGGICRWSQGDRLGIEFMETVNVERVRQPEKDTAPRQVSEFHRNLWKRAV